MRKLTRKKALYYSWILWETMARVDSERFTEMHLLKEHACHLLIRDGSIPKEMLCDLFEANVCPCCLYLKEHDMLCVYDECMKLCPGLPLWGTPYREHNLLIVPCEVHKDSLYDKARRSKLDPLLFHSTNDLIKEIAQGFKNLYENL